MVREPEYREVRLTNLEAGTSLATDAAAGTAAATSSAPGFMPAADKKFLDGIHSVKGADLTDADATLAINAGTWRVVPAATLSTNRVATLSPTTGTPIAGDQITVTRLDLTAHTYSIVDGGPGTPTLFVFANSKLGWALCQFDGTNWFLKAFGVQ